MTDVQETQLPGVGIRHDFVTRGGERIGVISHRTGHRELIMYDHDDPDACRQVLRLEEDEVRTLADLLGASQVAETVNHLQQSVEGLTIDWVPVGEFSQCTGRSLGNLGVRAQLGASIVAVMRGGRTIASPADDFVLAPGDTAVVVGTQEGIREMFALLQGE